jgi:tetratricopeptide (TPR) repeat protein
LDLWLEERYGEALSEYRQALSLLERMDDPPAHRLVFVHSRIAEILSIRIPDPDYVQAARHYRRAAAVAGHDTDAGGAALQNAEWCETRAGSRVAGSDRTTERSPSFQEAVSQEVPAEGQARQAFLRGNEHFQAGRFERALEEFQEAMALYEGIPNPLDDRRAALRNNVGQALFRLERYGEAASHLRQAADLWGSATAEGQRALATAELAEQRSREGDLRYSGTGEVGRESPTEATPAASASEAYNQARRLYEQARSGGFQVDAVRRAIEAYETYRRDHAPTGERAGEVSGRIRMLRERLPAGAAATARGVESTEAAPATADSRRAADLTVPRLPDPFSDMPSSPASSSRSGPAATAAQSPSERTAAVSPSTTGRGTQPAREGERAGGATGSAARSRSDGRPGFSLVASYQMKQIKRSGKLVYNMNHFRTENQAFAMTENIGDLYRRYGRDPRVFRAVTIDDPVFKQREILVTLDGQDAATFTEHLNFVTVKLEKRHQSGEVTSDEVVITPAKFNEGGNAFSLGYGFKGDDDRTAWLDYRFQALWSFHGGVGIQDPLEQYGFAHAGHSAAPSLSHGHG